MLSACLAGQTALGQTLTARQVLDRTAQALSQAKGLKVDFSATSAEGNWIGSLCLKGEKFVLQTDYATTWFDGHTQWTYLADADEVTVTHPTDAELQAINPYAWLSLYRTGYRLHLSEASGGQPGYVVRLQATRPDSDWQTVVLTIDRQTFRPTRIVMTPRGGMGATTIDITACHTGQAHPDSLFVFDREAHPTAEVIDLR